MKLTLFFSLLLLTFTAQANGQRWQDEAATGALLLADGQGQKIGRASCRERV